MTKRANRFDTIVNVAIICLIIALTLLCADKLINGPRKIKRQRDHIERCLSYYINPYADGWGITIPLDEVEDLLDILDEQQNRIEELENKIEELNTQIDDYIEEE